MRPVKQDEEQSFVKALSISVWDFEMIHVGPLI